jgi:hypothetical protein
MTSVINKELEVTSLLKFAMARETTAALTNCGRAPTMVTIFMVAIQDFSCNSRSQLVLKRIGFKK